MWDISICVAAIGALHFSCVASAAHFLFLRRIYVPDYKAMYLSLFNSVTDAIETLSNATEALKEAQKKAEEIYINSGENKEVDEKEI